MRFVVGMFLSLVLLASGFNCQAQQTKLDVKSVKSALEVLASYEGMVHGRYGIAVKKISTGEILYLENAQEYFVPASVQKLVTTYSAISFLGIDQTIGTEVYLKGEVDGETLKGNLFVETNGDPSFCKNLEAFEIFSSELIIALESKGVKQITGNIVAGQVVYKFATPQQWTYEDIANYYGAAAQDFNFLSNSYQLKFQMNDVEGSPVTIHSTIPEMPYSWECNVVTGPANSGDQAYILGAPFSNVRGVTGSIPPGQKLFTIKGSIAAPNELFVELLEKKLLAADIVVKGGSENPSASETILLQKEVPLKDIVKETNFKSNNLYAEALLRMIGMNNSIEAIPSIYNFLEDMGVDKSGIIYHDGSGLANSNAMTPKFAAELLCEAYSNSPEFLDVLPVAGVSGTMRYFNSERIKGKFAAKSGSMDGVMNYAGILTTENNEKLAVSLFVNGYSGSSRKMRAQLVKVIESLL